MIQVKTPASSDLAVGAGTHASTAAPPGARINSLTGLRMLAAGAVFASSVAQLRRTAAIPNRLNVFLVNGYTGVTLFFVLSGFVLTWNYGQRLGNHMSLRELRSFFVARLARIYPVYLFALAWVAARFTQEGLPDIWIHIFALQTWSGSLNTAYGYNAPAWSVSVEFFLYACFPLLIFGFRWIQRDYRTLLVSGALAVAFAGSMLAWVVLSGRGHLPQTSPDSAQRWLFVTPWARLGDFALGIAAAYLVMLVPRERPEWWGRVAQGLGLGIIVALMLSLTPWSAISLDFAYMIPSVLLIVGLALSPSTRLARALSTKTMLLLGEASFAFYLLHLPLLHLLPTTISPHTLDWALSTALNTAMILCVTVGIHTLVELPSRRLIKRVLDPRVRP